MPVVYSATGAEVVAHLRGGGGESRKFEMGRDVLPRVSPDPKSGGFAVSLVRDTKTGGLCGHCSRDVDEFASRLTRPLGLRSAQSVSRRLRRSAPLDRRLLFVAELTG